MHRPHNTLPATIALVALLLSSCQTMKSILSRDLEDEDYTVGELYADEYVQEVPYIPTATPTADEHQAGHVNPLGLSYSPDDNPQLYSAIQSWMGTPYQYGGTTRQGVDCSAFVGHIYRQVYNITLHRVADDIRKDVAPIGRHQLAEGDVVFFTNSKGRVSHVGIYLKDGLFAHASTSRGVILSRLDDKYWSAHFYKGGRNPLRKD